METLNIKLVIDNKVNRVVFAEADHLFVNLLASLLSLPLHSVIKIFEKDGVGGCISNIYESIEKLSDSYVDGLRFKDAGVFAGKQICLLPPGPKDEYDLVKTIRILLGKKYYCPKGHYFVADDYDVLCPGCGTLKDEDDFVKTIRILQPQGKKFYCPKGHNFVANDYGVLCPGCGTLMTQWIGPNGYSGYVVGLGVVTYMVTDNLAVMPLSTFAVLKRYGDITALEEKTVPVTTDKVLELLKTSLHFDNVLTKVFLGKKVKCESEQTKVHSNEAYK